MNLKIKKLTLKKNFQGNKIIYFNIEYSLNILRQQEALDKKDSTSFSEVQSLSF